MASAPSTPIVNWEEKSIGEIALVNYGYTAKASSNSSGPKFLRITDIQDGLVNWDNVPYCPIEENDYAKHKLLEGDIVFARTGATTGKSFLVTDPPESVAASYLIRLRINNEGIYPSFLSLFFQTRDYWETISSGTEGAAQGGFNASKLSKLQLPLPPLAEQERIVGILDEAFEGIAAATAQAEKNLHNARELFQSVLQSTFSQKGDDWEETTLGDAFTTVTGNTPSKSKAELYGNFMPLAKPPELCDATFDSASDSLSEAGAKVARVLPPNSILVSCIGNLGKIGLNSVSVAFNQQINAILPNESKALPRLMFFQALSPIFKEQLEELASGTTVPIVNKTKFNSVNIGLPPLPTQQAIVEKLDALSEETKALEAIYERKQSALAELKQSLLQKAFAGEL